MFARVKCAKIETLPSTICISRVPFLIFSDALPQLEKIWHKVRGLDLICCLVPYESMIIVSGTEVKPTSVGGNTLLQIDGSFHR